MIQILRSYYYNKRRYVEYLLDNKKVIEII
jgi:hypothetical protein